MKRSAAIWSTFSLWKNVRHNFQSFFSTRINSEPGTAATCGFHLNDFSVQTLTSNLAKTWHAFVAGRAADAWQHNSCSAPTYFLVISTLLFLLSVLCYRKGCKTLDVMKTYSFCHTLFRLPGALGFVLWLHGESGNSAWTLTGSVSCFLVSIGIIGYSLMCNRWWMWRWTEPSSLIKHLETNEFLFQVSKFLFS